MKRRFYYLLALIFLVVFCGYWYVHQTSFSLISFSIDQGELLFFENGMRAQTLIAEGRCKVAVNGSYFGKRENGNFFPAGVWMSDDLQFKIPSKDLNLQNTIRFYQNSGKADFSFEETLLPFSSGTVIFNSGPWLLQSGKINSQLEQEQSHRNYQVPRTLLAKDKDGQLSIVIVQNGISLQDLARFLQLQGWYDVINLDGGPSTSFATNSGSVRAFNSDELLPIFFCLKEKNA